jgi:hypothetical protein
MMQLDFNSFFGPGVNGKSTAQGGAGLPPRFFLRRLRVGFAGDFLKRWSFSATVDIGTDVDNSDGAAQLYAAPPGQTPNGSTARYRPVQGAAAKVNPADIWINYALCPCLNFQFGQFDPPVGMERRTQPWQLAFMERSLAVGSFVVPAGKETGLMVWGDIGDRVLSYELAVFGGDGQNRPEVDTAADFVGRITVKPLGGVKALKDAHVGVSARHGERDPNAVGYNYPAIASSQGYLLWNPNYVDSQSRRVHVIPSGAQNLIGGELRVPVGPVDIRGEGFYVANHTREAIDGYQLTNTERLGTVKGAAFYGQITWWAVGDAFISGDPGYERPQKLNLRKQEAIKRGLELSALFSGVFASYDGNSRGGDDDARTPGSTANPASKIKILQIGGAASYWHSKWVRMTLNYAAYLTPSSGTQSNLAVVPGNEVKGGSTTAHVLHELGTRLQLWF